MRNGRIDPRVEIGHIHLKVANLERALAFYQGVLGFEVTQRHGSSAVFLSAGGYHHHIGLNTWESEGGDPPPAGTTGLYHFAVRYPGRAALGDALNRLSEAGIPIEGASDHGVSEALYVRDPDGNGVELYCDRPREQWPRAADGTIRMETAPLDLQALRAAADAVDEGVGEPSTGVPAVRSDASDPGALSEATRARLKDMRVRLLQLHKVLLDDAKAAYEMDRGRVPSNTTLLQLVINDPWFAWLHLLSELVVRMDEALQPDAPATEADGILLLDQVAHLLSPERAPDEFGRRYYEALQRQPAVVLAHAEVRRILKQAR